MAHGERDPQGSLTPTEKDRLFNRAAIRYLNGEISAEEWHEAKRMYGPDWYSIFRYLARRQLNDKGR